MSVRVVEVEPSPMVVGVDFSRVLLEGIGPEVLAARANALENRVEVIFVDEEGVMLGRDGGTVYVQKIEGRAVFQFDHQEGAEGGGGL